MFPAWKPLAVGCMAAILLSSCSSGGDNTAATAPATTAQPGVSTTTRPVDTSFTGQDNARFCTLAKAYSERSGAVGAATTPAQLRANVDEVRTSVNQIAGAAPAEIRPDAQVLSKAFGTLFAELDKVNFDPGRVPLSALAPFQAPDFQQSTTRLQAYLKTVCGLG